MHFDNKNIIKEEWNVIYADDAYSIFSKLGEEISKTPKQNIKESHSWKLTNKYGEIEKFSGFNGFYGVGSKLTSESREKYINIINEKYKGALEENTYNTVISKVSDYLLNKASNDADRCSKVHLREEIIHYVSQSSNEEFIDVINKLLFRPINEMYIPIPNSRKFHEKYPDFFAKDAGKLKEGSSSLALSKQDREFQLIFEPSGKTIRSFITQDNGKAIESSIKQTYLGEWLLKGVFQLSDHEPLTTTKLTDLGINGIRLYKTDASNDIHLKFIWIDDNNLPEDYWK